MKLFFMLLQYCNFIKVIYVDIQNKTTRNIKHNYDFICFFFLFNG